MLTTRPVLDLGIRMHDAYYMSKQCDMLDIGLESKTYGRLRDPVVNMYTSYIGGALFSECFTLCGSSSAIYREDRHAWSCGKHFWGHVMLMLCMAEPRSSGSARKMKAFIFVKSFSSQRIDYLLSEHS
ncbi:hypothetical protein M514_00058 [Trichuris suis]|uniref:Uncharacterized protein n=1 Tax=Trichuris suis TaxID=68888 RepID=A0A085NTX5_9BILA|nr:hypothetical protein M513_00058 [Trichuris suis]KFD72921.1 hypothetical protein M514_00058 [Trichuris suis]